MADDDKKEKINKLLEEYENSNDPEKMFQIAQQVFELDGNRLDRHQRLFLLQNCQANRDVKEVADFISKNKEKFDYMLEEQLQICHNTLGTNQPSEKRLAAVQWVINLDASTLTDSEKDFFWQQVKEGKVSDEFQKSHQALIDEFKQKDEAEASALRAAELKAEQEKRIADNKEQLDNLHAQYAVATSDEEKFRRTRDIFNIEPTALSDGERKEFIRLLTIRKDMDAYITANKDKIGALIDIEALGDRMAETSDKILKNGLTVIKMNSMAASGSVAIDMSDFGLAGAEKAYITETQKNTKKNDYLNAYIEALDGNANPQETDRLLGELPHGFTTVVGRWFRRKSREEHEIRELIGKRKDIENLTQQFRDSEAAARRDDETPWAWGNIGTKLGQKWTRFKNKMMLRSPQRMAHRLAKRMTINELEAIQKELGLKERLDEIKGKLSRGVNDGLTPREIKDLENQQARYEAMIRRFEARKQLLDSKKQRLESRKPDDKPISEIQDVANRIKNRVAELRAKARKELEADIQYQLAIKSGQAAAAQAKIEKALENITNETVLRELIGNPPKVKPEVKEALEKALKIEKKEDSAKPATRENAKIEYCDENGNPAQLQTQPVVEKPHAEELETPPPAPVSNEERQEGLFDVGGATPKTDKPIETKPSLADILAETIKPDVVYDHNKGSTSFTRTEGQDGGPRFDLNFKDKEGQDRIPEKDELKQILKQMSKAGVQKMNLLSTKDGGLPIETQAALLKALDEYNGEHPKHEQIVITNRDVVDNRTKDVQCDENGWPKPKTVQQEEHLNTDERKPLEEVEVGSPNPPKPEKPDREEEKPEEPHSPKPKPVDRTEGQTFANEYAQALFISQADYSSMDEFKDAMKGVKDVELRKDCMALFAFNQALRNPDISEKDRKAIETHRNTILSSIKEQQLTPSKKRDRAHQKAKEMYRGYVASQSQSR